VNVCVGGTLWSPVCVVWFGAGIMQCLVYNTADCSVTICIHLEKQMKLLEIFYYLLIRHKDHDISALHLITVTLSDTRLQLRRG